MRSALDGLRDFSATVHGGVLPKAGGFHPTGTLSHVPDGWKDAI